jgi:membrane protease YdiL (CAAX protease family)
MRFTAGILAAILSYTWFLEPRVPRAFVAVPGAIVLVLGFWHSRRTREWGFASDALWRGLRAATFFTVPAVLAILIAGAARGTLHDPRGLPGRLAALVVWGSAQQWILQTVVLREAQRTISPRFGVIVAALLFASVHLPNPFLVAMTLVGALGWCAIYSRHPNILPLALAHAIATLAILCAFDDAITGRLRIGHAYLSLTP